MVGQTGEVKRLRAENKTLKADLERLETALIAQGQILDQCQKEEDKLEAELIAAKKALAAVRGQLTKCNHRNEKLLRDLGAAMRDAVTGIYTRSAANLEIFGADTGGEKRLPHGQFTVAMLDLDHMKEVNDVLGHHVGDRVLRKLAELSMSRLRLTDIIWRHGGDEFAVLLQECSKHEAEQIIRGIADAFNSYAERYINKRLREKGELKKHRVSYGLAQGRVNINAALKRADEALYDAKKQAKGEKPR